MPTLNPTTTTRVLVTGANGYVALWVVRVLLSQGYTVRGTVRSEEKGKQLAAYFSSTYGDRFEWVTVKDIAQEGAFDDAVKDVDAIEHTASPVTTTTDDPDDFIKPAVQGTLSILRSALKFGTNIKRIVITSSIGTILKTRADSDSDSDPTVPRTIDENDWADEHVELVNKLGKNAHFLTKYRASKVLAERAAWDFYEKHKTKVNWDMVVLNPTLVIGPPLQDFKTLADLNTSLAYWYTHMFKHQPDEVLKGTYGYIDAADLAAVHAEVLRNESVAGRRVIVAEGMATWQETRNLIHSIRPDLYASSSSLPRGNPELKSEPQFIYDPEKGKKMLGIEYRGLQEIVKNMLIYFETRGWIEAGKEKEV